MLITFGVPFTDTGMGLYLVDGKIGGLVRTTSWSEMMQDHIIQKNRIPFGKIGDANKYAQNIQMANLNASNAVMAVIRWKYDVLVGKLTGLLSFKIDFQTMEVLEYR